MPRIRKNILPQEVLDMMKRNRDILLPFNNLGDMKIGVYYENMPSASGHLYSGVCVGFIDIHGNSTRIRAILKYKNGLGGRYNFLDYKYAAVMIREYY